jgi:hypothetical protein
MTSLKTSHTKKVVNELSFPLVTHMTHYGILKTCSSSKHIKDGSDCIRSVSFWATRWVRLARVRLKLLKEIESAF